MRKVWDEKTKKIVKVDDKKAAESKKDDKKDDKKAAEK